MLRFQRGNLNFSSQSGLRKRNRDHAVQIIPPPLEKRMLLHMQHNVEIAMRPAVNAGLAESGESNASFILDARGDLRVNRFLLNSCGLRPCTWCTDR